jgi:transposase
MDGSGGEGRSGRCGAPDGRPEVRWSARRKQEVVLRLLRGESLDALARETGQAAGTISGWREAFLEGGQEGLKSRPRPVEERQLADAQRKIGELALDNDILRALVEEMGRRPRSPRR